MKKRIIKSLAEKSFTKGSLDEKNVSLITARLKRKDLRSYIRALKLIEHSQTVLVELPMDIPNLEKEQLQLKFPNKKVVYTLNKDLLAGMRIVDNDILYDYSLQDKIDTVIKHLYDSND